jgi:hypothetical protein
MKIILIAWFVHSSDGTSSAITAEYDSVEACEAAGVALHLEGDQGEGRNVIWRYVCTKK